MRRVWRVLALLGVLVLLAVAGFTALLTRVDGEAFAAGNARALSAALGREVTLEGGARVGLWPVPGLHSGRVTTADGMLEAPSAVLVPDPLALIAGETRPWAIVLIRPRMVLRLDAERPVAETWNGTLRHVGALAAAIRLQGWGATMDVRRASLLVSSWRGLSAHLTGDWNGQAVAARFLAQGEGKVSLALRAGADRLGYDGLLGRDGAGRPSADGRLSVATSDTGGLAAALGLSPPPAVRDAGNFELEAETRVLPDELRLKLSGAATVAGRTVSLRLTVRGGPDWRRDGAESVEAVTRGGGLYSAYFSGRQTGPDGVGGRLTLSVSDLPGFQDWLGVPEAVRFVGGARAALGADLSVEGEAVRLTGAEMSIDDVAFTGELGFGFGAPRSLTGAIALTELDLTDLHAAGYDRLRAALAALGNSGTDLAMTLEATRARLGGLVLGDLRAGLTRRDGDAVVEIDRIDVLDGVVSGRFSVAGTGPALVTGEAALAEVDAAAVSRVLGLDLLTGALAGSVRFKVPDLAAPDVGSLTVDGGISVSAGTIALPLAGGGPSFFRQLDAEFGLANGALALETLTMDTPDGRYTGRLSIGLAGGRLDGSTTGPDGRRLMLGGTLGAPETTLAEPVVPADDAAIPAETGGAGAPPPEDGAPSPVEEPVAGTGDDPGTGTVAGDGPSAAEDAPAASGPEDLTAADAEGPPSDATAPAIDPGVPIPVPAPR